MDKKLIAALGGVILAIGVFLPVANGAGQSISFISPGEDSPVIGFILLACGALGVILALMGQAKHAVWVGLAALGLLIWKFIQLKGLIDQANGMVSGTELPPEMAAQLSAAMPSMNMLGWGVLGLGALIMVVGGAMAWKSTAPAA
jgi:hypothetical protein